MNESIIDIVNEVKSLDTETAAALAWRKLCAALPREMPWPNRRRTGWGRDHYADPNAKGSNGSRGDLPCIYHGDIGSAIGQEGGQNAGSYIHDAQNDDILCFASDGRIYEIASVEGSWSQWQGSSSSYRMTWREFRGAVSDDVLSEVIAEVQDALTKYRDSLRDRKQAGAGAASKLLAALESL